MNSKITISIVIGIIIVIVGIVVATNQESSTMEVEDTLNRELEPIEENDPDILKKLEDIKKNVEETKGLETDYDPTRQREWITSGPFQIDRSEYVLGEKIFLRIGGLEFDEMGQVAFLKPSNATHYEVYLTIPFDGSDKPAFNYYLQPQLSKTRGFCTVDDFIGDWRVVFRGTDYSNLEFKITEDILPGDEDDFEPVC